MTELTDELKQEYKNYDQAELSEAFIAASYHGQLEIVKYLLTSPDLKGHADIHADSDYGFQVACLNGHLEVVKYLLTSPDLKGHADIHAKEYLGFQWACLNGHLDVMKYLLTSPELKDHADIHAVNDSAFQLTCRERHLDVIVYLLSLDDEQYIDFQKIEYNLDWALENKYDNIIIAMMKNLKKHNPFDYLDCLPKIEAYNADIYEQVKNIEVESLEVNPPETSLFV